MLAGGIGKAISKIVFSKIVWRKRERERERGAAGKKPSAESPKGPPGGPPEGSQRARGAKKKERT